MTESTRFPIATVLLVGANIVVAFVSLLAPTEVHGALFGPASWFIGLFVHRDLVHLAGNMVFLAAVGPAVELAAGHIRFLLVYLAGGVAGAFLHRAMAPVGGEPLVGASACVAACLAYYSVRYAAMRVPILPGKGVPFGAIAAFWVLMQAIGGISTGGGVSYWAHLGGFATGLLASLVFRVPKLAQVTFGHEALERLNERGPFAVLRAAEQFLKQHPNDVNAMRQIAEAHRTLGDSGEETATLLALLEVLPETEQDVVLHRLSQLEALGNLPTLRRMVLADRFAVPNPDLAKALLLSVVAGDSADPQVPEALFALASLQSGEGWAERLAAEYPMHPAADRAKSRGLLK